MKKESDVAVLETRYDQFTKSPIGYSKSFRIMHTQNKYATLLNTMF